MAVTMAPTATFSPTHSARLLGTIAVREKTPKLMQTAEFTSSFRPITPDFRTALIVIKNAASQN